MQESDAHEWLSRWRGRDEAEQQKDMNMRLVQASVHCAGRKRLTDTLQTAMLRSHGDLQSLTNGGHTRAGYTPVGHKYTPMLT